MGVCYKHLANPRKDSRLCWLKPIHMVMLSRGIKEEVLFRKEKHPGRRKQCSHYCNRIIIGERERKRFVLLASVLISACLLSLSDHPPNRFFSCIVIIAWLWKSSQLFKSLDEMIFLPTSSSQTPFKSYGWELRHKRSARPQREGESVARRPGVCSTPSAGKAGAILKLSF